MLIDSHAHFDMVIESTGEKPETLLKGYDAAGIARAVQVSVETDGFQWSREFAAANRDRGIVFTLGLHPSSRADESDLRILKDYTLETINSSERDLLFGIGECGLDFYRIHQIPEMQRRSFEFQIELARVTGLPVIVHSRDATEDTLAILREKKPPRGIMHCFPGDSHDAKRFLDLGFYISFAGNVTFRAATLIQDAARYVPDDRILAETDAPFLTPVPLRGKTNRCEYIRHTIDFIASIRQVKAEVLEDRIAENFNALCERK